jgi:alcohol dehydrogenase, propanol-preferring
VLDTSYLTVMPDDVDPIVLGPTLCAGVTAYKAVKNAGLEEGEWLVVVGAGGRLGHFAGKYMNVDTRRL